MKKLLALTLVSLFIFSGCRSKEIETPPVTAKAVELTIWNLFDNSDVFQGQIQSYQSKHPEVKINYKKFTNVEEYEQLLVNEIAQGEGPDIFAIQNNWTEKHQKKISVFPIGKTTVPLNPQIFDDTFFHVASNDLIRDGQIYALPLSIDTLALYYNKQVFLDNIPSTDKPADTWEGIKNQASILMKENNSLERFSLTGIAMGRGDNISRATDIFSALQIQFGVNAFNDALDRSLFGAQKGTVEGTGKAFYPFLEALQLYSSFGSPQYKNYSWNEAITSFSREAKELNPFLRGKVAMVFGYSYLYEDLLSMRRQMQTVGEEVIKEEDIGVVEFPQILPYSETGKRDALARYYPLTVSRNSKNADYAWDFLQYLTSKESLSDYSQKTKKPSSRKDLVEEQMIDPIYGIFARQASYAKSFPEKNPVDPEFLEKSFSQAMNEAIKNKRTLLDITLQVDKQINCQIEKQQKLGEINVDCLNINN